MPVCGRFRKSPQAGPCKRRSVPDAGHTHLTESRGEGDERPFPRLSLIFRPMSGIGALITRRPVSGCRSETAPFRVRGTFRFQGRATGPRPVSSCCCETAPIRVRGTSVLTGPRPVSSCRGETAPIRVRSTFRLQGRTTGPRPVSANVSSPSCPTASFANPDPGPPRPRVRRSASSDACRRRSFRPSSVPQKGRGAGGPPSHEGRFADGSSVFRRFQRGRFTRGFSSSRPTVRGGT